MTSAEAFALLYDSNDTAKRIAAMELHKIPSSKVLSTTAIQITPPTSHLGAATVTFMNQ